MESYLINTDISWGQRVEFPSSLSDLQKLFSGKQFWLNSPLGYQHWYQTACLPWVFKAQWIPLKIWSKTKESIQRNSPYFLVLTPGKIRGSYSGKHWFVFLKEINFCWEHELGYYPNHMLDQWPNLYSYRRVKMFIFQQIPAGHWGYLMDEAFAS